ncbi:universal stress protein [Mycolicibacterium gadium]|uniref:Universal stress protein n=1 Tax=Mycolicibacterium gadium TaxID=1794 RepID=A0ABT6GJP1_MYCGU|nr:universal stress protein [Mycolicibacterium gadium]MDG5481603.1 universal stress protein [Mycolicibacterium gadium]
MTESDSPKPVVAAIDGSGTAINAALWAVDEAISRSVPLRLVCVMKAKHPSAEDYYADKHHAEASIRAAQDAVEATGRPVKIETAILSGLPAFNLIEESQAADMICVGSVGIGRSARAILGSIATELAEKAHCPVAIIRPQDEIPRDEVDIRWMVVAATGESDNESVIESAMNEARLRQTPVLMLGGRDDLDDVVAQWKGRYPDVHAYPVSDGADVARFIKKHDEWVQLAVIGGSRADEVMQILGPWGHPLFHRRAASVLVVRH